jgi:hypothetical protein
MQLRRLALPVGVGLLGVAVIFPAALVTNFIQVSGIPVSFLVTASCGTLVWQYATGATPGRWRSTVAGVLAVLLSAPVSGIAIYLVTALTEGVPAPDSGLELLGILVFLATVFVLATVLLSIPAAILGAIVGTWPAFAPKRPLVSFEHLEPGTDRTYRRLRLVGVALVVLAVAIVGIQYTDPTNPAVGKAPDYAGPEAPPKRQVAQAAASTHAMSFAAEVQIMRHYPDGPSYEYSITQYRYDRTQDLVKRIHGREENNRTVELYTEDGSYEWKLVGGNRTNVSLDEMYTGGTEHRYPVGIDAPARLEYAREEEVQIHFADAKMATDGELEREQNRTVTIDPESGRVERIKENFVTEDGNVGLMMITYDYGNATVQHPTLPERPTKWHVLDALVGPITGETPLLKGPKTAFDFIDS